MRDPHLHLSLPTLKNNPRCYKELGRGAAHTCGKLIVRKVKGTGRTTAELLQSYYRTTAVPLQCRVHVSASCGTAHSPGLLKRGPAQARRQAALPLYDAGLQVARPRCVLALLSPASGMHGKQKV